MTLLVGSIVTGIAIGLIYGLLAFATVALFKATSIANFAQAQTGVLALFIALPVIRLGTVPVIAILVLVMVIGAVLGGGSYVVIQRVLDTGDHTNAVIRSLGVYLLMTAIAIAGWSQGEPYKIPSLAPAGSISIGDAYVSYLSIMSAGIALVLGLAMWWLFSHTRAGLIFLGIAANRWVARLLGARVARYDVAAWTGAGAIAGLVALLVAPSQLLTTDMLDVFLLYAFTAAIVGGLDSLGGAWLGGVVVGVLSSVTSVYLSPELSTLTVFGLLVVALMWRPQGLLGAAKIERL